jgi:hypothetical protein
MKLRFPALSVLAALLVLGCVAGSVFAQDATDTFTVHPKFTRLHFNNNAPPPPTPLTQWQGSYTYGGAKYSYRMVGTRPSTGTSTTVPVYVIPVILKFTVNSTTYTFTPETKQSNGRTAIVNTLQSPIFKDMDWVAASGTDLGTTQYEDAFQRGNFWGMVSKAPGYHVLLGTPTVTKTLELTVPAADGTVATAFGTTVGIANVDWIDAKIQTDITKLAIPANALPIFITYNVYLSENSGTSGCCIGGYHSYTGTQAYAEFNYIGTPGAFAEDVAALSHEVGEWMDDPETNNTNVPALCGEDGNRSQILEVGDPEEVDANYGTFPYTLGGFTYHLQDLVYLEYFGAPSTTSVGGEMTFQNNPFDLTVCSNGG